MRSLATSAISPRPFVARDNRNRLIAEARVGQHPYSLAYAYDIAGNRTVKVDVLNDVTTVYTYDVSDPEAYGSQGNRLMAEVTSDTGFTVEERWYTYDIIGNVDMVIRRIAGDLDPLGKQWYRGTRLYYAKNGRLWISRSERWRLNRNELAANCEPLAAMEYRYDGARARYMVRPRDPDTMLPYSDDDGDWFDYAGNSIYNDYTVDYDGQTTVTATNAMSHVPGLAQFDLLTGDLHHLHGNLIGTTELMTDDPISGIPTVANRTVMTAFGEPVYESGTGGTRYGYAGAWGYQSPASADPLADLGWLHVGARYYDPACGRFVQRDPIGIRGGLSVYAYTTNEPTSRVDPSGLQPTPRMSEAEVGRCQDACDAWVMAGAPCGVHKAINDCYTSCNNGYWPPAAGFPTPVSAKPWLGPCPPCDTGVPTPDTGRPNKPIRLPRNLPVNPPRPPPPGGGGLDVQETVSGALVHLGILAFLGVCLLPRRTPGITTNSASLAVNVSGAHQGSRQSGGNDASA